MRKKKPFKVLEKQLKYDYIVIQLFKGLKIFLFGLSTSIGDSGMGHPEYGTYHMSLSPNPWKGLKTIK
jgi:hypothetical protein